ncbi:MAG: HAD-IA family hydrolase [Prevotella sp.]|nr:HAD-IA family hydrolase [Prevotella sp.]
MMHDAIAAYIERHGLERFAPQAVLFDMDGVLFNSMPNHAHSWHKSMTECGLEMSEKDAYLFEGMRGVETIKQLAREQWHRELNDDEAQQLYQIKCDYFAACPPAQKMTGVEELMTWLHDHGYAIGVVTGSGQHSLLDALEQTFLGLVHKQYIVTAFDVLHGKPSPEPYLAGLKKVGVDATQAIVVENAPLGVQSAVAAGIFTIAVNTGPLPDEILKEAGADIVVKDMAAAMKGIKILKN